jgi:hypothetical protein
MVRSKLLFADVLEKMALLLIIYFIQNPTGSCRLVESIGNRRLNHV